VEAASALAEYRMRSLHRHACIPRDRAGTFLEACWSSRTTSAAAREGYTSYALVVALYPADFPTLPERVT